MTQTKLSVILYAVFLSVALLLPAVAMPFLNHEARAEWENRNLTKLPELKQALIDPKPTFSQLDDYTNDHIGGSFQVIKFRKNFHYNYLGNTGDKYIARGRNGAMFLTAPFSDKNRKKPFIWWKNLCVQMQTERIQKSYAQQVKESHALLSSRGAKVIYSSVPTKPGLMPENASASTPIDLKQACAEYSTGKKHIDILETLVPEAHFFYPFEAFKDRISDPQFYPTVSYHWSGESGWVFAEEFAKKFGLKLSSKWDHGPCQIQKVRWDIGKLAGVADETIGCDRDFSKLDLTDYSKFEFPIDTYVAAIDDKLSNPVKSIKMVKFDNPNVNTGSSAIIISNSFGRNGAHQLASLFTTTYHFNTNGVSTPKLNKLYLHSDFLEVDYIIVLAGDFHYPKFLKNVRVKDFNPEK